MNYKYKLSVCLCIKNEAKYIENFIKHYIKQGVDHFYIVNNNSNDNLEEIIENSVFKHSISIITDSRQLNIYNGYDNDNGIKSFINNNFYDIIVKETEWIIFVDLDEYMFGKNGYTIKSYLDTINGEVGGIYVLWSIINPCKENNEITKEFSIKKNVNRLNYDLIGNLSPNIVKCNDFGKSLLRTSMLKGQIGLHKTFNINGTTINNYGENKNTFYDNCNQIDFSEENYKKINITLNHYNIRHLEDYTKKYKQFSMMEKERNAMLSGSIEMVELDDSYFIKDNYINYF
jgi:glycosyltransferase involved in cell wall biosynthesis